MQPVAARDYTPFGYLRNPGHRARSWRDTQGGNLRIMPERVGVEWAYPTQRRPQSRIGLAMGVELDGRVVHTRDELTTAGISIACTYHSCSVSGFDVTYQGCSASVQFFLEGEDALCARVSPCAFGWLRLLAVAHAADGTLHTVPLTGEPAVIADGHVALVEESHDERRAVLARGPDTTATARAAARDMRASRARLLAEDAAFVANCPALLGDWPSGWREGMFHDFETTRMLVQPPGGAFTDVWPAWMVSWPRVVLAEGALDMLRLAYADARLAQRAVLSMFRDAARPNVPCVFFDGTPNMVAADGGVCGTSPAWCLPFVHLELLYLQNLDREWLGQLYPHVRAFVEWWLAERRDADGWIVYKCTWEAGEDGNPRLDPTGRGDADISRRIRPVELQATVAHAARVLALFATELGETGDVQRWRALEAEYTRRTRRLFDAHEGRYRDWVLEPAPADVGPYWGVDTLRYSALSLTPLLLGLPLDVEEVWRHASPPWTLWPSWTCVLVEAATAAGETRRVGELVADLVERVYAVTTRRDLGDFERPLPGAAPEFWPLDWRTFDGHDAYGWGATTTNLLIRHLAGFHPSRRTDACVFELAPALPRRLLDGGRRLGIGPLTYRGARFSLWYSDEHAELDFGESPRGCRVLLIQGDARRPQYAAAAGRLHRFEARPGQQYEIELS